jgi:thioredoxin-dependent peroxiredoxin
MKTLTLTLAVSTVIACSSLQADQPSDFTVPSALDDSKFQLSENRGKTVVLHFLLKTECPYCLRYTHEYAKLAAKSPDVVHVFLKPDSEADIRQWASHLDKADLQALPKIYRDADAKLAKQFKVPEGYKFHGQSVHYPALIALDGQGKEMFRHVGKSNSDRMAVADFTKKLDAGRVKQ